MNERIYEILRYLIENCNKPLSVNFLAKTFDLSPRSIRNYLGDVEKYLNENNYDQLLSKEKGYITLSLDKGDEAEITDRISKIDYYSYKLSSSERRFVISLILLTNNTFITLDTFTELLYVSKSTVFKDMNIIIKQFADEGISINGQKTKGYALDTSERKRRDLILKITKKQGIYSLDIFDEHNKGLLLNVLMHYLKIDLYYRAVESAIYVTEHHYNINFTEESFKELIYFICIVLARVTDNNILSTSNQEEVILTDATNIARKIIELSYNKTLEQSELYYIAEKLQTTKKVLKDNDGNKENINYYFVVKSFLFKLSVDYGLNLSKDYKLQEFLTSHINQVHNRLSNNEGMLNPYKNILIEDYSEKYTILKRNIKIIENVVGNALSDDEISFIFMHVLAAIERIKQEDYKLNVVLICDSGLGTSSFLEERLKRCFNFNVVGLYSSHSFNASFYIPNQLSNPKYDLAISTVNLTGVPATWVRVTPIVNDEDLKRINEVVDLVNRKKEVNIEDNIAQTLQSDFQREKQITFRDIRKYLKIENVSLDQTAQDWKSAIRLASKPLVENNTITNSYIQSIIKNVIVNGPYFVLTPGVAIAHSGSKCGVNTFGLSFLRLKEGVVFGSAENDPVRIIVIIAIVDSNQIKDLLFKLMNVLCTKDNYQKFLDVKDYEGLMTIFSEKV